MKIEYKMILKTPAITAATGIIGKEVDIAVKRNINGQSYYSAKHIKGVLRSKVLEFKNALGKSGEDFTNKYFGHGGKKNNKKSIKSEISKLRFSNLFLEKNNEKMNEKETNKEVTYRHGVKINRKTRTAEENTLFSYEFVRPNNIYGGSIEVDNIEKEDLKFILACLFHIDKIGGLKSRGLGRVEIRVVTKNELKGIEELDNIVDELYKPATNRYNLKNNSYESFEYEIKLLEPIILQGRATKNEIESRRSLQTSTVRGALIQYGLNKGIDIENLLDISVGEIIKYVKKKKDKEEKSEMIPEVKLASSFITKYPVDKNGKLEKETIDKVVDIRNEYKEVKLERNPLSVLSPVGSEINIKINNKTRTGEEGLLFNAEYIEIKENEEIIFKGIAKVPAGLFKLGKVYELKIGKFKSKGYGKVEMKFLKKSSESVSKEEIDKKICALNKVVAEKLKKIEKEKDVKFNEVDKKLRDGEKILITIDLMSDIILPMNQVQNVGKEIRLLFGEIGEKLELNTKRTFVNVEKLRGFNIVNEFRKSDEIVITSGSVLSYTIKKEEKNSILDKLSEIENNGIGLRRNEGFGRIRICSER